MTPLLAVPLFLAALFSPPQSVAAAPRAVWPLDSRPEIVRGFEPPPKPWLPGHRGLDLRGSPGQQVRSATHGKVTYAAPLAGRGVIVITNGPLRTTYEPVIPTVRAGTSVTPGTPLGTLSAAASHCAPATCLHWGLIQATTYLNPLALLPQHPIRLLPVTPHMAPPHARPSHAINVAPAPPAPASPLPGTADSDRLETQTSARGDLTSGVLVGLAATATLIGSLLIKRH